MNSRPMRMCTAHKRVKDLPISAQGLPAVRRAGLPASGGLARRPSGGLVSLGLIYPPYSLPASGGFIRRLCGGLAGSFR